MKKNVIYLFIETLCPFLVAFFRGQADTGHGAEGKDRPVETGPEDQQTE